jgi:hypothetical protein
MSHDPYQCFLTNFRFLMESSQKKQTVLAMEIKITPRHLNSILKGRSRAGYKLQNSIASYFETTLDEMQKKGEQTLNGYKSRGLSILERLRELEDRIKKLENIVGSSLQT